MYDFAPCLCLFFNHRKKAFREHRFERNEAKVAKLRQEAEEGVRQASRMRHSVGSGRYEMGGG